MFDFPGKRAYLILLAVAALDMLLLWWLPAISISGQQLLMAMAPPAVGLLVLHLIRTSMASPSDERGLPMWAVDRLTVLTGCLTFLLFGWIALRLFNHLTMALAFPFVDDKLAAADGLLGLSWMGYFQFVIGNPTILNLMDWCYQSLNLVSVVGCIALIALGEVKRARFFVETFMVTAIVCTAIGCLFPAEAAVKFFIGGPEMFPGQSTDLGLYHMMHLEQLRSGLPVLLDLNNLPGLVTIPSLHTAAGVILIWSFRQTSLRVPATAYSLVMIASTPVLGGHYFIDIIAGALVAAGILIAFQRTAQYRDLFNVTIPARQSVKAADQA